MNSTDSDAINALFAAIPQQQGQFDMLANNALSRGIDLYQNGKYASSEREFRRAIGLSPYSQNTSRAYDFLVQSLLRQDRTDEAIRTYKQAIRLDRTNDGYHVNLGNIYTSQGDYDKAIAEYSEAVRINPTSTLNRYSLGQAQLQAGQLAPAEATFKTVAAQAPRDANVLFALGQTYRRMGRYTDAEDRLKAALTLKQDFAYARLELGMTYADMKDFDAARTQGTALASADRSLAQQLSSYIYQVQSPRMLVAYSPDGFTSAAGPGTSLSDIDPALATPGASKNFTMRIVFSKEMDALSVMTPAYWRISRASGGDVGSLYNWGQRVPAAEAAIAPLPIRVVYHADSQTADVTFRLTQNAAGNATIDPSHIVFRFSGRDAYGLTMDAAADEYSGFSMIA